MTNASDTKKKPEKTMAQQYASTLSEAGAMLDLIGQELKRHEQDTLNEQDNWGRLGELKYVHGRLSEILITLIGGEDCQQAAKMIREHLDTLVGEDA